MKYHHGKGETITAKESPGRYRQTEGHVNGCCGSPRKGECDDNVRWNGYLEESLVPQPRRFRSLRDLDEHSHDRPWKTERSEEPTDSAVPRIGKIQAGDNCQSKHHHRKAVCPYDFTRKARRTLRRYNRNATNSSRGTINPNAAKTIRPQIDIKPGINSG